MRKYTLTFIIILQSYFVFSQGSVNYNGPDLGQSIKNYVPAAPATAKLLDDVNLSYDNPMGKVNATFNLFNLECNTIAIPITLSYSYSGFKPQSDAGSVGLGFNINTGNGVIIKQIGGSKENYISDAINQGMPQYPSTSQAVDAWFYGKSDCYQLNVCRGQKDLQPEMYQISLSGKSVKMFRGAGGVIYTSPKVNWTIAGSDATGYTIMTEDGTIYTFDKKQSSTTSSWSDGASVINSTSAFYLTKMKHANLKDSVVFNYAGNNYSISQKIDDVTFTELTNKADAFQGTSSPLPNQIYKAPYVYNTSVNRNDQTFNDFVLTGAISNTMRLDFHGSFNRTDIATGENKYKLDSISLYNKDNVFLKRVVFNYSYFYSGGTPISGYFLKLMNIEEKTNNRKKQLASFNYYNESNLQNYNSSSFDHWGYCNIDALSTGTSPLIPALIPETVLDDFTKLPGVNRDPIFENTLPGALKTITYPTKGTINFNYEQNDYDLTAKKVGVKYYTYASVVKSVVLNTGVIKEDSIRVQFPQTVDLKGYYLPKTNNSQDPPQTDIELLRNNVRISLITVTPTTTSYVLPIYLNDTGWYKIRVSAEISGYRGEGQLVIQKKTLITDSLLLSNKVGGLRIKDIQYIDNGIINKKIKFKYNTYNSALSSGILMGKPTYNYSTYVPIAKDLNQMFIVKAGDWQYTTRTSTSVAPLSTNEGYHVFYKQVTVEDSGVGKQLSTYSFSADLKKNKFPFPPPTSNEELRGKLLNQKTWDKTGALLKETNTTFDFSKNNRWIFGMKGGVEKENPYPTLIGGCIPDPNNWFLSCYSYKINQVWSIVTQNKEISYNSSAQKIEKISNFEYDTLTLNVLKQSYTQSDGKVRSSTFKYANDFSLPGNVYEKMVNRHMINQVIETSDYVDNVLIYTKRTNYFEPYTNLIVPQSEETFKAGGVLESRITYDSYDATTGKLKQLKQTNGTPIALLWSTQNNKLIAKVSNALPTEVFYENFESPINTNTQFHTGEKSLAGDYSCSFTLPNTKSYVVDYWYFDGSNWNYLKKPYTNGMLLSEGSHIDNVRIYPKDAMMLSYTYKIYTGITSEEAPDGKILKYEYDDFQRLVVLRDQYNNILKTLDYNYKP
jgi:YD repeat-containing protein